VLDAELEAVLLSKAAQLGLPAEWVSLLDELDQERRQVLRVRSTVAASAAGRSLHSGDLILAVNGQPVTSFTDVEERVALLWEPCASLSSGAAAGPAAGPAAAEPQERPTKRQRSGFDVEQEQPVQHQQQQAQQQQQQQQQQSPCVEVTLFRSGAVLDVTVKLGQEDSLGTDRLVHWCGAQLQAPHRAVRELGFMPEGASGGGLGGTGAWGCGWRDVLVLDHAWGLKPPLLPPRITGC
jgi:hypothetical protein